MNDKWSKRVDGIGSESYLHDYAVAVIYDMLQLPSNSPMYLLQHNGNWSSDVFEGMGVASMNPDIAIAGRVPDIVIYDSAHNPIRVIEVCVNTISSMLSIEQVERYKAIGLQIVEVRVKRPSDLRSIFKFSSVYHIENSSIKAQCDFSEWGQRRQDDIDDSARQLIQTITDCSPRFRRAILKVIKEMYLIENQYPVMMNNPKWEILDRGQK